MTVADFKHLSDELSEKSGLRLGALVPTEGGMDSSASCFMNETYFVKLKSSVPAGLLLASQLAIPGVLSPLQIIELPNQSTAIVYPRLDAVNGFEKPLRLEHWVQVGRILRQVHDFTGPTSYLATESFHVPGVESLSHSPLANLVLARRPEIDWIVEEIESLGVHLSNQEWEFVPCHADLHVGNIVTNDHDLWLLDWDTGRLAPRECDLVFFLENGILDMHGISEEEAFWSGYGELSFSPELIRYYQLARVLEDLIAFAEDGNDEWFMRQFESKLLRKAVRSTE